MEVGQTYPTYLQISQVWIQIYGQNISIKECGHVCLDKSTSTRQPLSMQDMTQILLSSSDTNLIMDSKLSHNDLL